MKSYRIDLGCGEGNRLARYQKQNRLLGIDIDPENIGICQKNYPEGVWIAGNAETVSLTNYTPVDTIKCIEVIEHVDDWKKVIRTLSQVPSGATLFLTTPYKAAEEKLLRIRPNYWKEIGHQHFFVGKEIHHELQKNGWTAITIKRRNAALFFELTALFKKNAPCVRNTYYQNILPLPLRLFFQLFRTDLFDTRLKYIPIWIFTLPIGRLLDIFFGATLVVKAKKS